MIQGSIFKRLALSAVILVIIVAAAIFIYRYQLIQYSAEKFIRKALPGYISIDTISFDANANKVVLRGFRVLNAPGFSPKYALEIDEIACRFKLKGKLFLDGLEILEPSFVKPLINIERLQDGKVNLVEMGKFIAEESKKPPVPVDAVAKKESPAKMAANPKAKSQKKLSDVLKLPETFAVKDGTIVITDRMVSQPKPHVLTFDNVNSKLSLKLNQSYTSIIDAGSIGQGIVNNDKSEVVKWNISIKPSAPRLTMSNRFDVSNVDLRLFEPYYDKYSPFIFHKAYMSGTLVFDFDNGSIGSTNEVHLRDVSISVKQNYENAAFWGTTVQDLARYFTQFGEIVFDFKIKGEMSDPHFYLGPISKEALTSMAIDKVSTIIQEAARGVNSEKPETDKAKQYIDLIQGLIKKK